MISYRILERPAFDVIGKRTWISGQDNGLFGAFWERCRAEGLFAAFEQLSGMRAGPQTGGVTLGISAVEKDPARRDFDYWIAVENPEGRTADGLERYRVPASRWAVFECRGQVPDSIVQAEMYAFMEWLPASGFVHANAPEMEVYPPGPAGSSDDSYCEFWLPITTKV